LLPALENSALFSDDKSPEPLNEEGEHGPPYWRALVPAWLDAPLSRACAPVAELVLHYLHSLALPPTADLQTVSSAAALVDSILAAAAVPAVEEERWDVTPLRSLQDLAALCRRYEELDAIQQELTAIGGAFATLFILVVSGFKFFFLFLEITSKVPYNVLEPVLGIRIRVHRICIFWGARGSISPELRIRLRIRILPFFFD
jgi:hypothetical protein